MREFFFVGGEKDKKVRNEFYNIIRGDFMTIQKKDLLKKLGLCMSGIEKGNPILQGADSFIFYNGRIYAYNDMIYVSVPIENKELIAENLDGAVRAEEFFKIINKMPNEEIQFEVSPKHSWILKSGKARAELALVDFDYVTRLNEFKITDEWVDLDDDFFTGLNVCRMARNTTPLAGTFINGKFIVSTDGYQINRFQMKDCDLPEFWVSDHSMNELLKFNKFNKVQVQESWVHFKSESDVVFSLKTLVTANYPYRKFAPLIDNVDFSTMVKGKFPMGIGDVVERASVFDISLESHSAVKLTIDSDGVEVSSENAVGNYSEKVAWDDGKKDFEKIAVYVDAEMIRSASSKTLEFYLQKVDGKPPRLFFITDSSIHLMSTLANKK